jgi:4'-phosphopantetheinyl transferase EntD
VIEEILASTVSAEEAFDDRVEAVFFPEEAAIVANAVDKRRREFMAARACAHRALTRLGVQLSPILTGERGVPIWPEGVVGSITHCTGYRAAAVAHVREVLTIGIDAEPNEGLPSDVLTLISLKPERVMLAELAELDGTCWDRLLFSVKETVYKAWFPITGHILDFKDVQVTINPAEGTFSARILISASAHGKSGPTDFTGNWMGRDGLLLTAVARQA